jgi:hypothetical protein
MIIKSQFGQPSGKAILFRITWCYPLLTLHPSAFTD